MEVAAEAGAIGVDTWTELQKDAGWRGLLNDGLHLCARERSDDASAPTLTPLDLRARI